MLLAERRQYTLPGKKVLHADVTVIPTGELKVDIKEMHSHLKAEFEELHFCCGRSKTDLVCENQVGKHAVRWHIYLAKQDAEELEELIENAEEDYEILMRDL